MCRRRPHITLTSFYHYFPIEFSRVFVFWATGLYILAREVSSYSVGGKEIIDSLTMAHSLLGAFTASITPSTLVIIFIAVPLLYSIIRALLSPLRHVPGPPVSLFTSAVLRYHELRCHRTRYVHSLHEKYGPVVRLAPDEVSFSSAAAVKEIYNTAGSGYDKTAFYDLFTVYGRRTMFTTLDKETVGQCNYDVVLTVSSTFSLIIN